MTQRHVGANISEQRPIGWTVSPLHRCLSHVAIENQGTFHMKGSRMVVDSGGGYYNKPGSMDTTQFSYIPDGVFHKPTIHVAFFTNGSPVAGLNCEKQDHD